METNLLEIVQKLMDPQVVRSLPEDFQESPVGFLESTRWLPAASYDPQSEPEHTRLFNEIERIEEEMQKLVPAKNREFLARLCVNYQDTMANLNQIEIKNLYRNGLRDGFWLAMELLANRPDVLATDNSADKGGEKGEMKREYPVASN